MANSKQKPDPLSDKLFGRTSAIGGTLALAYVMRRYKGALPAIAESVGDRLCEILPSEGDRVEVKGPVLDVKWGNASSSCGILGLHLLERGTSDEKLMRVFEAAGDSFQGVVAAAHHDRWPQCKQLQRACACTAAALQALIVGGDPRSAVAEFV